MLEHDGRKKWILLGVGLAVLLVLVCAPRFNRQERPTLKAVTTHELGDAAVYMAYVRHFRGEDQGENLYAPFTYRPLVPLLAAGLPFEPMTAINLVNIAALFVALFALLQILVHLGFGIRAAALGGLAFVLSFPTFYYGAIGYVDSGILCLLSLGVWAVLRDKLLGTILVLCLGASCKETIILLLPVIAARCFRIGGGKRFVSLPAFAGMTVGTLVLLWLARLFAPGPPDFVWVPSMEWFLGNLARPRTLISLGLSLSYPGLFALLFLFLYRRRILECPALRALSVGFVATVVLSIFALFGTHGDGRLIWLSYPFSIPLALEYFRYRGWIRASAGSPIGTRPVA